MLDLAHVNASRCKHRLLYLQLQLKTVTNCQILLDSKVISLKIHIARS